jgi:hypothetical protein
MEELDSEICQACSKTINRNWHDIGEMMIVEDIKEKATTETQNIR